MKKLAKDLALIPLGEPEREGTGERLVVDAGKGGRALLYRWGSCGAKRVVRAHRDDLAGQLFAAPQLLTADPRAGWTLHTHPRGVPLTHWLRQHGHASIAQLDPARHRMLFESMGVLARKLHSLKAPGIFGEIPAHDDPSPTHHARIWNTFNGWVANALNEYASALDEHGGTGRLQLKESLGDLRHELSAFHPRHPAVLTHGAFGPEHMWVDEKGLEVVALTGFDMARFLPAEADLANMLFLEDLMASELGVKFFYQGYGAARTMDVQRRERFYRRLFTFEVLLGERQGARLPHDEAGFVRLAGPSV